MDDVQGDRTELASSPPTVSLEYHTDRRMCDGAHHGFLQVYLLVILWRDSISQVRHVRGYDSP